MTNTVRHASATGPTLGWLRVALAFMVLNLHYGFFRLQAQPWLDAHFGELAWVNDGAIAVFGFFSLSGYLVGDMIGSGRYRLENVGDFWRFVLARWARIYPLYWLVLMAWMLTQNWPGWQAVIGNLLLWPYGLWSFWYDQKRYGPLFDHILLVPAWTLALDLILYPIGALLARHNGQWLLFWIGLALAWWVAAAWMAPEQTGKVAYAWWHFRYWTGAGSGVLAFTLGLALQRWGGVLGRPVWSGVFAVVVVLWCCYLPLGLGFFSASLLATVALAWLVYILAARGRGKYDVALGNFTYGLYLVHIPIVTWLGFWLQGSPLLVSAMAFSIFLAAFLAIGVEAPLERLRRRWMSMSETPLVKMQQQHWGLPWLIAMTAVMTAATVNYIVMAVQWGR